MSWLSWLAIVLLISELIGAFLVKRSYKTLKRIKLLSREDKSHYWPFMRVDAHLWTRWRFYAWAWLVPLRFAGTILTIFGYFLIVKILLFHINFNQKRSYRMIALRGITYLATRILLFWQGFFWIRIIRKQPDLSRYPLLQPATTKASTIVSNHLSHYDIIYQLHVEQPSFIAKHDVKNIALVGPIAKALFCLFVQRGKNSHQILEQLKIRQKEIELHPLHPRLFIFPEGTVTNGTSILKFKKGAFVAKRSIRVKALRYKGRLFNPVQDCVGMFDCTVLTFSQPWTSLFVYEIGEVELRDPENTTHEQYAQAVRTLISDTLGLKKCDSMTWKESYQFFDLINKTKI